MFENRHSSLVNKKYQPNMGAFRNGRCNRNLRNGTLVVYSKDWDCQYLDSHQHHLPALSAVRAFYEKVVRSYSGFSSAPTFQVHNCQLLMNLGQQLHTSCA